MTREVQKYAEVFVRARSRRPHLGESSWLLWCLALLGFVLVAAGIEMLGR